MSRRMTELRLRKIRSAGLFRDECLITDSTASTPFLAITAAYHAWCARTGNVIAPGGVLLDALGELGPGATCRFRIKAI